MKDWLAYKGTALEKKFKELGCKMISQILEAKRNEKNIKNGSEHKSITKLSNKKLQFIKCCDVCKIL